MIDQPIGSTPVPNATAVLVLGIISIPTCICFGVVGLACGIIALVLSSKAHALYNANPELYTQSSLSNLKGGKICAIIGTCLSAIYTIYMIFYLIFFGTAAFTMFEVMKNMKH